jgi:hypothetical protein
VSTEVYSYNVTSRGAAAIRRASLFGDDGESVSIGDTPVYSRAMTLQFIAHFQRCLQEFDASFSVLLADSLMVSEGLNGHAPLAHWLIRLREAVRDVDMVGQLADARFIVLLPQTKQRAAETLVAKIQTALGSESPFNFTAVEITSVPQLTQLVAGRNSLRPSA